MTPKERVVMQQALEALEELFHSNSTKVAVEKYNTAHNALRKALSEQAEQEPMYISESCAERGCACHYSVEVDGEPVAVYSAPVRTKDLTDDEIREMFNWYVAPETLLMFRAVIAADR